MSTKRLNLSEARTQLSQEIDSMSEDDRILLCKRNEPVAEVSRITQATVNKGMQLGVVVGELSLPDSFTAADADIADMFRDS